MALKPTRPLRRLPGRRPTAITMPSRPPLTHFLCIPLATTASRPQWDASLSSFRQHMVARPEFAGLNERFVRPTGSIHLTLGVMSLTSPARVEAATKFLQSIDFAALLQQAAASSWRSTATPNTPLEVTFGGLTSFSPPHTTSVLVLKPFVLRPYPKHALERFCNSVVTLFEDAGFVIHDDRGLNLHATVINTLYASGGRSKDSNGHRLRVPKVDARPIIHAWEHVTFVDKMAVDKIAICKMGAQKIEVGGAVVDEAYEEVTSKPIGGANR